MVVCRPPSEGKQKEKRVSVPWAGTGSGGWSEIPLFCACRGVWRCDTHHDAPPGAVTLGIARRVAQRVLARQLVGDLAVDARQLGNVAGEEHAPAGLLCQLAQHEL